MKVIGKMIKLMVMVFTHILMVLDMKENGRMTSSMDMVLKDGQMVPNMRVNT